MKFDTYPSPVELEYFSEIAATLNLSRAAERLGVGQPTLSLSLKKLEDQVRAQLFIRRHRGLVLTEAGSRLLKETESLKSAWNAVIQAAQNSQSEIQGRFSLGCHPSVALYSLDPFLKTLYASEPKIEIKLVHGLSRAMTEKLISGELDFAIVVNPVRHPDLVLSKLAVDEICFWKSSRALEDVLIYNPALLQSQDLLKKLKTRAFTRAIESDNLEVICSLTRSGAGVGVLPTRLVEALAPSLTRINELPRYKDEIYFAYRADKPKTAAAKLLISQLRALKI